MATLAFMGTHEIILILFISIFILLFPLLGLISVLKNEFEGNNKLIWVLLILFLPFIGALLYFLIGRKKRIK